MGAGDGGAREGDREESSTEKEPCTTRTGLAGSKYLAESDSAKWRLSAENGDLERPEAVRDGAGRGLSGAVLDGEHGDSEKWGEGDTYRARWFGLSRTCEGNRLDAGRDNVSSTMYTVVQTDGR